MRSRRNCDDNLWQVMTATGHRLTETPSPFNLWQNTPVDADGSIAHYPAASKKGDYVLMRAEMDIVLCLSACPMDLTPINSGRPRNAHVEVLT